ncbi:hypothetical protein A7U60_g6661 [Sanghuangporus baumii]|uniref:Uncharacterized protein n=1 Tax=Sanghuangporus baumii TaxID=108892 RepID=A0A9Q5HUU4_SANBA|nr:hypothetical protein A7U60_g6661 [Sanghuangporus baumii]
MEPIMDLVMKRGIVKNGADDLQKELLFVLTEAMNDPSSPWAKLVPKAPPVVGPRTPEQYLCVVDIAINARKEAKEKTKIAKFWKQLVSTTTNSLGEGVPLTPSPSDISDTGLSEPLSSTRKLGMEELIAKRRGVAAVSEIKVDVGSDDDSIEYRGMSDESHFFDPSSITCVSPEPACARKPDLDTIPTSCKSENASCSTKSRIPSLKRHQTTPPHAVLQDADSSIHPGLLTRPHTCCNKSRSIQSKSQSSRTALSSVQTKCRMYESLSSCPSSTPARSSLPLRTSIPSVMENLLLEGGYAKVRSGSLRAATTKVEESTQSGTCLTSSGVRKVASQLKSSCIPQARRGQTGLSSTKSSDKNCTLVIMP